MLESVGAAVLPVGVWRGSTLLLCYHNSPCDDDEEEEDDAAATVAIFAFSQDGARDKSVEPRHGEKATLSQEKSPSHTLPQVSLCRYSLCVVTVGVVSFLTDPSKSTGANMANRANKTLVSPEIASDFLAFGWSTFWVVV